MKLITVLQINMSKTLYYQLTNLGVSKGKRYTLLNMTLRTKTKHEKCICCLQFFWNYIKPR